MTSFALTTLALAASAYAQGAGTLTKETHPQLTTETCTGPGECTTNQNYVVLDANWRWVHSSSGTNCYTGNEWDATLCPDPKTCAENCYLDGGDYAGTYGITTSGNALTLDFVTGSNVGSRTYLMDTDNKAYNLFDLKNKEFTFDVDVSELPCGLNGALYFVAMPADGGASEYPTNTAGAAYGTGYCDAQCPQDIKFIDGEANVLNWTSTNRNSGNGQWGSCCTEMDIWEANSISTAYTPHACSPGGPSKCDSDATCGNGDDRNSGNCDKNGCDFNSWRNGNHTFYGPGSTFTLDTTKKMTVVTQFITSDGTDTGDLTEIKRIYVQDGVVFQNSEADVTGITGNSITTDYCAAESTTYGQVNTFAARGGLKTMGDEFAKGMVLVMSLWDDYSVDMLWLDSDYPTTSDPTAPGVSRGSCATTSGKPADVEGQHGSAKVTYSNIKTGPHGSTYSGTAAPGGSSSGSAPLC